jgi:hypothetical protein
MHKDNVDESFKQNYKLMTSTTNIQLIFSTEAGSQKNQLAVYNRHKKEQNKKQRKMITTNNDQ